VSAQPNPGLTGTEIAIAAWGVLGVLILFGQAMARLGARAIEAHAMPLGPLEIGVSLTWAILNAYAEGYRAFQLRFSPRVVARALYLARRPRPLFVVFAPLFCMAFFHATRRARTIAWATTCMVICLIALLRHVPQPWRGIVDGGVVIALGWGAVAIVVFFLRAVLLGREPSASPQVPAD
jgi:hypothetical protein